MITRVSSSLVQEADRLPVQRHELALKADVANLGDVLVTVTPIVFKKDRNGGSGIPMRAVQSDLKDILASHGLWDLDGLGWREVGGSREVQVVAILEKLECFRGSGGGRGVDENGVKFNLAGEAGGWNCVSFANSAIR